MCRNVLVLCPKFQANKKNGRSKQKKENGNSRPKK
jgi:hypothetical protein